MNIGLVIDDSLDTPDGVQQYVMTLGSWFSGQGHIVHYLCGQTKNNKTDNIHSLSKNLRVKFNQNRLSVPLPVKRSKIKQVLGQLNLDVLHVQMPCSPFMAGRVIGIGKSMGIPVVGTYHILPVGSLQKAANKLLMSYARKTLSKTDQFIAVSEPAKEFADDVLPSECIVIPNPVDLKKFQDKSIRQTRNPDNIVFLGRLVERKGCVQFISALDRLRAEVDDMPQVYICGNGPLRSRLKKMTSDFGLSDKIVFTGQVTESEKLKYLSRATLAVFPSTGGESFGIVLLEAMAAGAETVIAGDNPGYRFVMQGRQLVNPNDTEEFAKLIKSYLVSKSKRDSAKLWQTQRVEQFDVGLVGAQILSVYQQVIAKNTV